MKTTLSSTWLMRFLMVLAVSTMPPRVCAQTQCSGSQLSNCQCYSSYSSSVYSPQSGPAVLCANSPAAGMNGDSMNPVLEHMRKSGNSRTLLTLKISNYKGTTSIDGDAFGAFFMLKELSLNDMPIGSIRNTAFSNLTQLVALSLTQLKSSRSALTINISSLLPHSPRLEMIDLSGSRVLEVARGSFQGKTVKVLLLRNTEIASLTQDLLTSLTNVSLAGNNWHCNLCICPLVLKVSRITWTDRDQSLCSQSSSMAMNRTLLSALSCGCGGVPDGLDMCTEAGIYKCPGTGSITAPASLNCTHPAAAAAAAQVDCSLSPTMVSTTAAERPGDTPEDDGALEKIRDFLTGTVGIATVSVCALLLLVTATAISVSCRRDRRKRQQAEIAQRLLQELRANTVMSARGSSQGGDFGFPEFGGGTGDFSFDDQATSIMLSISSGLNNDNARSQRALPAGSQEGSGTKRAFWSKKGSGTGRVLQTIPKSPDKMKQSNGTAVPQPDVSPPRPLLQSRPGSTMSSTSLRNQPIFEEDEDGDPVE